MSDCRFMRILLMAAFMLIWAASFGDVGAEDKAAVFEDLGEPVRGAPFRTCMVGPSVSGEGEMIYFLFNTTIKPFFILVVDPDSGESHQYWAPENVGSVQPEGMIVGPDDRVYFGTCEPGALLVFDPKEPQKGIQFIDYAAPGRSGYIWQLVNSPDGRIYGCTYPNASVFSYNPADGSLKDHGRMDNTQYYARSIAVSSRGRVYVGIGTAKQRIVAYDPATGEKRQLVPIEDQYPPNCGDAVQGADGEAYVSFKGRHGGTFRSVSRSETAESIARAGSDASVIDAIAEAVSEEAPDQEQGLMGVEASKLEKKYATGIELELEEGLLVRYTNDVPVKPIRLADGREVRDVDVGLGNLTFDLFDPEHKKARSFEFSYDAPAVHIHTVGAGPSGVVYAATSYPSTLVAYDSDKGRLSIIGPCGGTVMSMLPYNGKLYLGRYAGSVIHLYDPSHPEKGVPGLGHAGQGHCRPYAMIAGPDNMIYIGSDAGYGQPSGAMSIWDPRRNEAVTNYWPLVVNQSIVNLAYDPVSGLVFGGTGNYRGRGLTPAGKQALFFAFDPEAEQNGVVDLVRALEGNQLKDGERIDDAVQLPQLEEESPGLDEKAEESEQNIKSTYCSKLVLLTPLVPGAQRYTGMLAHQGKIWFAVGNMLFVYDTTERKIIHRIELPGEQLAGCGGNALGVLESDGMIYGATRGEGGAVFRIDPSTFEMTILIRRSIGDNGFALTESGIYFGMGSHLMRYRW